MISTVSNFLVRCLQTDVTTLNIVRLTSWELIVASVFAAMCKRMQQLPTMLGSGVHRGKDTTHKTLETICDHVHDHVYCGRTWPLRKWIQHCCATFRRSQNKRNVGSCWLKSLTGFKLCTTTPNNTQQLATTCKRMRKRTQYTISKKVASVCTGLYPFPR